MSPLPARLLALRHICSALLFVAGITAAARDGKWTLGVMGDQQWAVTETRGGDHFQCFSTQIDWLTANAARLNLRMIVQVGDIVEKPTVVREWERGAAQMARLDRSRNADGGVGIPWSVSFGNHEIIGARLRPDRDLAGPEPTILYRYYYGSLTGSHRYSNQPEFRGASPNDLNTWHLVRSSARPEARTYLLLNLEIDIPGKKAGTRFDALSWAQGVIDAHSGLPTIITTHVFEGSRHGPPDNAYLEGFGHNSQREIFDKLIAPNPQIFLVLSGHTNEATHTFRRNAAGQEVLQMVTDYSKSVGLAGDGFFRLITFDETAGTLSVETYSALLDRARTDGDSRFSFPLDFSARFGPRPAPPAAN